MPSSDDLRRAVECQNQAAMRMASYWIYRNRGEKENSEAELKTAVRMHQYAGEFYREARELMGLHER